MLPNMSRLWLCLEDNAVVQMSAAELDTEMCGVFFSSGSERGAVTHSRLVLYGTDCQCWSWAPKGPCLSLSHSTSPQPYYRGCRVHVSGDCTTLR